MADHKHLINRKDAEAFQHPSKPGWIESAVSAHCKNGSRNRDFVVHHWRGDAPRV